MTSSNAADKVPTPSATTPAQWTEVTMERRRTAVLVVDMVESVRLMSEHEAAIVTKWDRFMWAATQTILPKHQGRLVKSLGDGFMAEFDHPVQAVETAWALNQQLRQWSAEFPGEQTIKLRAGVHVTDRYGNGQDIFGHGVNVAVRVAALAQPSRTVITADVRDSLVDGWDAEITDLGDCYLKHISQPVRVYQVEPPHHPSIAETHMVAQPDFRSAAAVMPFVSRHHGEGPPLLAIGDLIADGVVALLTRSPVLKVISRLSTIPQAMTTDAHTQRLGSLLKADYLVSGAYSCAGSRVLVTVMLTEVRSGQVIWSDRLETDFMDLTALHSVACHHIGEMVHRQITDRAVQQALTAPMPTLESHALLLAGVQLMHRSSAASFQTSQQVLGELSSRYPRSAVCSAWQANWHVLAITRGLSVGQKPEIALEHTRAALQSEPDNSLALAVEGFVYLHLLRNMEQADVRLRQALQANPNDAMALIFKAVVDGFSDRGVESLQFAESALALTSLHPLRYYFESLAASCAVCSGDYVKAIDWCEVSLRRNKTHASTYRTLIAALVSAGRTGEARGVAHSLLELNPGFSVSAYRENFVSATSAVGELVADGLRVAGIPE